MNYWPLVNAVISKIQWNKLFRSRQRCLLVVDDDPVDANFLQSLIQNTGHDAETVSTGEGALALVKQKPDRYAIIFLDLRMPRLNGLLLLPRLLAINPRIHAIIVCGLLDDLADLDAPGIYFGCLPKPVTNEAVRAVILKTKM